MALDSIALRRLRQRQGRGLPPQGDRWDLDTVLLDLGAGNLWTLRDACEAVGIWGQPGSGKTTGSGASLMRSYLRLGMGGVWLTAKPTDRADCLRLCAETGRRDDVIETGPGRPGRLNVLDYLVSSAGSSAGNVAENIVHVVREVASLFDEGEGSRGDDRTWARAQDDFMRNGVDLLRAAGEPVSLANLAKLIRTAPKSREEVAVAQQVAASSGDRDEEGPRRGYFASCWSQAGSRFAAGEAVLDRHSLDQTIAFFTQAWPEMPEKTRGSVEFTFLSMASPLLRGDLAELFCTTTNLTPEETFDGKILLLDLPVKVHLAAGAVAQAISKTLWQKAVERRAVEASAGNVRPVFLWADEYQNFATRGDLSFLSTTRSARACSILLTQNLASIRERLGADACENLTGLLGTKVFHANGCPETNAWAARIIGEDWRHTASYSSEGSVNFQRVREELVDPIAFSRLGVREAYVHRAGAGWGGGKTNHVRVRFRG